MKQYIYVMRDTLLDLEDIVNFKISQGYKPIGGITHISVDTGVDRFVQAMIEAEDEN